MGTVTGKVDRGHGTKTNAYDHAMCSVSVAPKLAQSVLTALSYAVARGGSSATSLLQGKGVPSLF